MINHWLDISLKRWAHWYQVRMVDRSMGYAKESPIVNFGMPPSTGRVWDGAGFVEDWSDCQELNELMRTKLAKSSPNAYKVLHLYYVDSKCVLRSAARAWGCHHNTFREKLSMAMAQLDVLMQEKTTVQKPLERLTV